MRALVGSLVLLAGCAEISGLGTLEVCDGACVDATADVTADSGAQDSSSNVDASKDAQSPFDAAPDGPAVGDGTIDVATPPGCTKPTDCSQNDFCCGTLKTQGNAPQCTISNVTTKCTASCTTMIGLQQCATDTVRMCEASADCVEPQYNKCCKFPYNNAYVDICSNAFLADAGGGSCQ